MNDLKQCPFCGSEAQLLIIPGRVAYWVVRCSKGCCITDKHISDHDAEQAWNKRTAKEQEAEYEKGYNDAMLGKQESMYEGTDGKQHKKDW